MKKDRFVAFFDAIMAIIMTIVVLEFVIPNGTKWSDLSVLWTQILAYALSFFWLGQMWINIHGTWTKVENVSRSVLFVNITMLFFASMIPYFVVYVGSNINEKLPQLLYGVDVMIIVLINQISAELLSKENEELKPVVKKTRVFVLIDESIKVIGLIIGMTVYPPAVMIAVFTAMIVLAVLFGLQNKKLKKGDRINEKIT